MSSTIGATLFIHNGVEYDYCFKEAILSVLPIVDQMVVVDAESTDTTMEVIKSIPTDKIKTVLAPWKPEVLIQSEDKDWSRDLGEIARKHLETPMHLYLNADEVVHEDDHNLIRELAAMKRPAIFKRLNFWLDHRHLAPHHHVCGHAICRLAPTEVPVAWGCEVLLAREAYHSNARLFHYGFIRKGEGFRKKSEIMGKTFVGVIDPIIYEYEKEGPQALEKAHPKDKLLKYEGTHPKVAHDWLRERGFEV